MNIQRLDNRIEARRRGGSQIAAAVAGVLLLSQAARAAEAPILEEIIVTAERRAAAEQQTSISMNVLTAEDLAESQTKNFGDLQNSTPNVTINQPGTFNVINIRGIGNSAITPAITTGVAVFQDGLLNAETITLGGGFLDPGSIEVLRGPQGTFVGASSTGGAIRVNSVLPDFNGISGYVEGLVGTKSDRKLTGAVTLPISDTWAARVAFNTENRDSYFYSANNVAAPNANPLKKPGSVDETNMRATLLWRPNDSFEAIFRAESNTTDHSGSASQPNPRLFTNAEGELTHSRYWNYDDPNHDPEVLSMNRYDQQDVTLAERYSADLRYTFGNGIQLRSLTGFVHNENRIMEDTDGSSANATINHNDVGPDNNYYSQEFNLISAPGPINWIVGASWFYRNTPVHLVFETTTPTCGISSADGSFTACPPEFPAYGGIGTPSLTFLDFASTARAVGVFGQLNWQATDSLEATFGVRMNYDRNFIRQKNGIEVVIPAPVAAGPFIGLPLQTCPPSIQGRHQLRQADPANYSCLLLGADAEQEDDVPTWKVGLNWTPGGKGGDHLIYAFWSRGYKSGGVDQVGEFEHEKVDDYELGWKGTLADGRVQLSLGGYWMEYENYQQSAYLATTVNAATGPYNIGSATMKGLEAEFNSRFGNFGLSAGAGWLDSELGSISLIDRSAALDSAVRAPGSSRDLPQCAPGAIPTTPPSCVDWTPYYKSVAGLNNVYSPELSYNATITYDIAAGNGTVTPRVNFVHIDEQDTNLLRREAYYSIPERNIINASVTYAVNDWLVQAFCNNCADKTYIASVQGDNADNVYYGAPITYGVRVRRSF